MVGVAEVMKSRKCDLLQKVSGMNFVNVQLFLQTSAPSIVHVDEFHEELSMAERRKREAEERLRQNTAPNKQRFFMELNKKVRASSSGHIVPV